MELLINILLFLIIYIIPIAVFVIYGRRMGYSQMTLIIITIIYISISLITSQVTYNFLPFIIVLVDIRFMRKVGIRNDYKLYKFNIKEFSLFKGIKIALMTYILCMTVTALTTILLNHFNFKLEDQQVVREMVDFPMKKFLTMVPITLIFAPVVEEFIFRWMIFEKALKGYIGVYGGAILSSLMFSAAHNNLKAFPVLFTIGLMNCFLIHKKGYWFAVFNHLFFNSVTVLVLLYGKLM